MLLLLCFESLLIICALFYLPFLFNKILERSQCGNVDGSFNYLFIFNKEVNFNWAFP